MAGLSGSGFDAKRTADVRADMVADIEASAEFGEDAQTGADKVLGQVLDPAADRIGEVWEQQQAVYDAWDPDAAEDVQLDNLAKLAGLTREPATASTAVLTLGGTPTTFIAAGKRSRVPGGGIFAHDDDATIGGGGTVDVAATATETGPIEAALGSIDEIVDTVAGWDTVINAADAVIGRNIESNAAFRARREESQSAAGTSTDQAMRAALVALEAVTAAAVISNRTLDTDALGIPGKSFRAIVWPDTLTTAEEELAAEVIWNHLPTGIYPDGSDVVVSVTDSQGKEQIVRFDYAIPVNIYWHIYVNTKIGWPSNGADLIEEAILAYGQALLVGNDVEPVHAERLIVDPTQNPYFVDGVKHLDVRLGKAPSPTGTTPVEIAENEISQHAAARVTVTILT